MFAAVETGDLRAMMDAVNEGADVNAVYPEWNDICPLHRAAESGEAGAVEWLVLYFAWRVLSLSVCNNSHILVLELVRLGNSGVLVPLTSL